MDFHEKIQKLRKQKGLTQEELAQALFVSRTAISKWESGRGRPNLESLKAMAKFFGVTVDELLSGEELLAVAEADSKQRENHLRDLVFGLLDCSTAMLLFLPFFGQKAEGVIQEVSLLSLNAVSAWLKISYLAIVAGMVLWGVLTLALQNCQTIFWVRNRGRVSLILNALAAVLFMLSLQPYGAVFSFVILIVKALMVIKWQ